MRLTNEQLEGMSMWDRDVMLDERHRAAGSLLVKLAVDEIRGRRAADLNPDEIDILRTTRDEMSQWDFLPEIPRLIAVLDKLIGRMP